MLSGERFGCLLKHLTTACALTGSRGLAPCTCSSTGSLLALPFDPSQFTRHNTGRWMHRPGSAGIPILGMYSSFHPGVVRQHAFWMVEAGVNCILVDWSNNLWGGALFCFPHFCLMLVADCL